MRITPPEQRSPMPAFDRKAFERRMGNNGELCKRILALFMQDTPRQLAFLNQSVAAHDMSDVQRAAHSIKGAAASLGAEAVHRAAYDVETASQEGSIDQVRGRISELEWAFASFLEAISQDSL